MVVTVNRGCYNWRAGASEPSRATGTIFLYNMFFSVCHIVFHDFTQARCTVNRSNFTYTVSHACANIISIPIYRFNLLHITEGLRVGWRYIQLFSVLQLAAFCVVPVN